MPETADGPLDDLSAEQQEALIELANAQLERDGPSRRDLLAAGGVLGAGALLGGGAATAAIGPASAQYPGQIGTEDKPVDVKGGTVSTANLNGVVNASRYDDFASAVSDTPAGGTLFLPSGDYDVADFGRINTVKPINIIGAGWGRDDDDYVGTKIINDGSDAVDEPVIDINGTSARGVTVQNLSISHDGDSAAISFRDVTRNLIDNVRVKLNGNAPKGILWDDDAWFAVAHRVYVTHQTKAAFEIQGGGSEHIIRECHTYTNQSGAYGVRTFNHGTKIIGGQINVGPDSEWAIQFRNTSDSDKQSGLVDRVLMEQGDCIQITGDTDPFRKVHIREPEFLFNDDFGTAVQFDRATDCVLVRPQVRNRTAGGELVEWTSDHSRCGLIADYESSRSPMTNNGGFRSWMSVPNLMADFNLSAISTVPDAVMVGSASSHDGSPAWYDGSDWRVADSSIINP